MHSLVRSLTHTCAVMTGGFLSTVWPRLSFGLSFTPATAGLGPKVLRVAHLGVLLACLVTSASVGACGFDPMVSLTSGWRIALLSRQKHGPWLLTEGQPCPSSSPAPPMGTPLLVRAHLRVTVIEGVPSLTVWQIVASGLTRLVPYLPPTNPRVGPLVHSIGAA